MTPPTYKIIRVSRKGRQNVEKVVARGLLLEEAHRKRDELNRLEQSLNPHLTSWTRDLFNLEIENGPL